MKKINSIEAAGVIGGHCKTCVSNYEVVVIGGTPSCKELIKCTDKHGTTTTIKDAPANMCSSANRS